MYNWSTDTARLKENPEAWEIYQLEESINFGLNNQKIDEAKLRKHWNLLRIDPNKKRYLATLLWPNKF